MAAAIRQALEKSRDEAGAADTGSGFATQGRLGLVVLKGMIRREFDENAEEGSYNLSESVGCKPVNTRLTDARIRTPWFAGFQWLAT